MFEYLKMGTLGRTKGGESCAAREKKLGKLLSFLHTSSLEWGEVSSVVLHPSVLLSIELRAPCSFLLHFFGAHLKFTTCQH